MSDLKKNTDFSEEFADGSWLAKKQSEIFANQVENDHVCFSHRTSFPDFIIISVSDHK